MTAPVLTLENLSVRFGGVHAVQDVGFTCAGGVTGIVGPNGAGKTTVLNAVSGFVTPFGGRVRLGEHDVTRQPAHVRVRAGVARSFQTPVLAPQLTVRENLEAGGRADVPDHFSARVLIADLGLAEWMDRHVGALPYGARKLLDIARALRTGPRLLLCDEPLSGLDDGQRDQMVAILSAIAGRGVRLVVVEHDVPRIRGLADQLVVMNLGAKIADGAPDDVLADDAVVEAFLGSAEGGAS